MFLKLNLTFVSFINFIYYNKFRFNFFIIWNLLKKKYSILINAIEVYNILFLKILI